MQGCASINAISNGLRIPLMEDVWAGLIVFVDLPERDD